MSTFTSEYDWRDARDTFKKLWRQGAYYLRDMWKYRSIRSAYQSQYWYEVEFPNTAFLLDNTSRPYRWDGRAENGYDACAKAVRALSRRLEHKNQDELRTPETVAYRKVDQIRQRLRVSAKLGTTDIKEVIDDLGVALEFLSAYEPD